MIERYQLQHALERRGVSEWVVIERDQELALYGDDGEPLRRAEHRTRWQLTVHEDLAPHGSKLAGRGSAHLAIDATAGDPETVVDQAVALARASFGPGWLSTPQAAPARVKLIDEQLASEPLAVAEVLRRGVRPLAGITVTGTASMLREQVYALARGGFQAQWLAALARVELLVASDTHALAITREARQPRELALDDAVLDAAADLALLAKAGPPPTGPCTLVLGAEAMLHGGLGVWEAFALQADGVVERQGLTRYRPGMPIAPGAEHDQDPLSIESNGALDFATRSAPIGDEGDAVRRFPLVERGVAAGLGLSPREAALRHQDPNGGVRNLVVATGGWSGHAVEAAGARVIEVRRLRSLSVDPYTGEASLEIALGISAEQPFTGGTVRLDLITALARARRSRTRLRRAAYSGPDALWIERAELI
jgi:predicted Zn-dependent protease